jgi:hypothetical protein
VIVGSTFEGDNNETLKWIQHDTYSRNVGMLFWYAREHYTQAARLVGVQTELAERIARADQFDHRVLQDAHDEIAAYYRFAYDGRGQIPLPLEGTPPYQAWLQQHWTTFFEAEVQALAQDPAIARAILNAVAYQNTDRGYASEKELLALLKLRYGPLVERTKEEEA